jgi:flagellar basal-body rod protein FlgB
VSGLNGILGSKAISALEQMGAFTEARQKVIAENIANVDTPGYQHKQVGLESFQQALSQAMQAGASDQPLGPVSSDQVQYDATGHMVLRPGITPADNLTFHDGTNGQIEKDMTEMAQNTLLHQVSAEMLARKYRGLETAIRGQVS